MLVVIAAFAGGTSMFGMNPVIEYLSRVRSFLGYPSSNELVPGITVAPIGAQMDRVLLLVGILTLAMCNPAFIDNGAMLVSMPLLLGTYIFGAATSFGAFASAVSNIKSTEFQDVIAAISESTNQIEKESLFIGCVASDNSPFLLHQSLLMEHAHFLGDTGVGKTSRGICPLIEQLMLLKPCSIVVLDGKGDSLELLATGEAMITKQQAANRKPHALEVFSLASDRKTMGFNPFLTTGFDRLTIQEQAEAIAIAAGLDYGPGYGPGFFSAVNLTLIKMALSKVGKAKRFLDLYQALAAILKQGSRAIHPELKRHGLHVEEAFNQLGRVNSINAHPDFDSDPNRFNMDVARYFSEPTFAYFQIPCALSGNVGPGIGRIVTSMLLLAAQKVERKLPVYLIIDEFQRFARRDFESVLQLARSMGVSVILANQSLEDLKSSSPTLLNTIETNCHFRQWFSVSSSADMQRMVRYAGLRTEIEEVVSHTPNGTSVTRREIEVNRLGVNEIQAVSDNPSLSIVRVSNDQVGYARYGGLPVVVKTFYSITREEYDRRKDYAWPSHLPGMFDGGEIDLTPNVAFGATSTAPPSFTDPNDDFGSPSISTWDPNAFPA
jgi:hypothetical protein